MEGFLKFLFAWWDTPLYLWSFETLAGLFILISIATGVVAVILGWDE